MARASVDAFLRRLTREMVAETLADQSDRQLVERFLADRSEAVFEALVRRHGPMVYRVCWRLLQQEQDTEDAFQATFLLLAQNLRTLRKQTSLASWLHGIARRVALKARSQAAARRRHEQQAPVPQPVRPEEVNWGELHAALDVEIAQMPEKWRLPLILCYLEGRTQDEAAEQLGWSKSTLRRRLDEARAALGRRLSRRGLWPAALSAVLLSDCVATALPPPLVVATVESTAGVVAGQAAALPVRILALAEGVRLSMSQTLINQALWMLLLVVSSIVTVAGLSTSSAAPESPSPSATRGELLPQKAQRDNSERDAKADALAGRWLMTLPAGFQYVVIVRPLGAKRYAVEKAVRFSGVYELQQGRLILIKGTDPAEHGFEWGLHKSGELVLVAQPPLNTIGQNYLGATLRRLADGQEPTPKERRPDAPDLHSA